VAIGGLGGVGGSPFVTLARLGIGRFTIADFDVFDVVNFNRQVGATVGSLHQPKIDVLAKMTAILIPRLIFDSFQKGVQVTRLTIFLTEVDVYVDGLDFFAFSARRVTFAACERKGIPVVTAAPLGLGTALLVFGPGGMSYEDYFGFEGCDEMEMAIRFLVGLIAGHAAAWLCC
jgi:tRNA A37 threonylcarbamoyladenosine dehydratase